MSPEHLSGPQTSVGRWGPQAVVIRGVAVGGQVRTLKSPGPGGQQPCLRWAWTPLR